MIFIVLIVSLTILKIVLHTIYLVRCDTRMDRFKRMGIIYFFMKYMIVVTPVFYGDVFAEKNASINIYRLKTVNRVISICLIICYIVLITNVLMAIK